MSSLIPSSGKTECSVSKSFPPLKEDALMKRNNTACVDPVAQEKTDCTVLNESSPSMKLTLKVGSSDLAGVTVAGGSMGGLDGLGPLRDAPGVGCPQGSQLRLVHYGTLLYPVHSPTVATFGPPYNFHLAPPIVTPGYVIPLPANNNVEKNVALSGELKDRTEQCSATTKDVEPSVNSIEDCQPQPEPIGTTTAAEDNLEPLASFPSKSNEMRCIESSDQQVLAQPEGDTGSINAGGWIPPSIARLGRPPKNPNSVNCPVGLQNAGGWMPPSNARLGRPPRCPLSVNCPAVGLQPPLPPVDMSKEIWRKSLLWRYFKHIQGGTACIICRCTVANVDSAILEDHLSKNHKHIYSFFQKEYTQEIGEVSQVMKKPLRTYSRARKTREREQVPHSLFKEKRGLEQKFDKLLKRSPRCDPNRLKTKDRSYNNLYCMNTISKKQSYSKNFGIFPKNTFSESSTTDSGKSAVLSPCPPALKIIQKCNTKSSIKETNLGTEIMEKEPPVTDCSDNFTPVVIEESCCVVTKEEPQEMPELIVPDFVYQTDTAAVEHSSPLPSWLKNDPDPYPTVPEATQKERKQPVPYVGQCKMDSLKIELEPNEEVILG